MGFEIPEKESMDRLYYLVSKLYKNKFYEFVKDLGQRVFYITTHEEKVVVVVDGQERKIDIFKSLEDLVTCHFLFSGDNYNLRTYDLSYFSIEEINLTENEYPGLNYYMNEYKHHKVDDNVYTAYLVNKPGEMVTFFEESHVLIAINVLEKLFTIQKHMQKNQIRPNKDEDMVILADFGFYIRKCNIEFEPLEHFDFLYGEFSLLSGGYSAKVGKDDYEIKEGVLHIGQAYGLTPVEVYDKIPKIDIYLKPIFLYASTFNGDFNYLIYSSTYEKRFESLCIAFENLLKKVGLYDTIITDNIVIYALFEESFKELGIDFILEPHNPYNAIISGYFIGLEEADLDEIEEALEIGKTRLMEVLKDGFDVAFEKFAESYVDEDEMDEDEINEDFDDGEYYVS